MGHKRLEFTRPRCFLCPVKAFVFSALLALSVSIRATPEDASARPIPDLKAEAEKGDPSAQFELGVAYQFGKAVGKNPVESVKWFRMAAEKGNALGQFGLGVMYRKGTGVEKDYAKAVKWYRKAAEQNNAMAQFNLGDCFEYGLGVVKDYVEAKMWYRNAAEQGKATF